MEDKNKIVYLNNEKTRFYTAGEGPIEDTVLPPTSNVFIVILIAILIAFSIFYLAFLLDNPVIKVFDHATYNYEKKYTILHWKDGSTTLYRGKIVFDWEKGAIYKVYKWHRKKLKENDI